MKDARTMVFAWHKQESSDILALRRSEKLEPCIAPGAELQEFEHFFKWLKQTTFDIFYSRRRADYEQDKEKLARSWR